MEALANDHERLMQDPAFRQAALDARRTEYAGKRADLVRALRITPAQADRIIDFWAARDLIQNQVGLSTAAAPDYARIQAINERAAQEILVEERALREAVGEIADRLPAYEATRTSRMKVDALRAQAGKAGEPVPENQIEPLVAILHAAQQEADSELVAFNATLDWQGGPSLPLVLEVERRRLELAARRNSRVLAEARALLSTPQLDQFDRLMAEQLAIERARVEMLAARAALARGSPDGQRQ